MECLSRCRCYTLSTSIKVNANKLIQESYTHEHTHGLSLFIGNVSCFYDNFLSFMIPYYFFFVFFYVCKGHIYNNNNNNSSYTIYLFTAELMCGTTTMNARNILKCVGELSLAFTWHVLVCEWRATVFAPRIQCMWKGFSRNVFQCCEGENSSALGERVCE